MPSTSAHPLVRALAQDATFFKDALGKVLEAYTLEEARGTDQHIAPAESLDSGPLGKADARAHGAANLRTRSMRVRQSAQPARPRVDSNHRPAD